MAEEQQGEAEPPPLKIDEAERIIARLEQVVRDRRVVLVGGQAVAIWASRLEDRIAEALVEAVASRDIDLLKLVWPLDHNRMANTATRSES